MLDETCQIKMQNFIFEKSADESVVSCLVNACHDSLKFLQQLNYYFFNQKRDVGDNPVTIKASKCEVKHNKSQFVTAGSEVFDNQKCQSAKD